MTMPIHMTYELYLQRDDAGPPVFEALTCADELQVFSLVQAMLAARGLRAVEVRRLGAHLFTLAA